MDFPKNLGKLTVIGIADLESYQLGDSYKMIPEETLKEAAASDPASLITVSVVVPARDEANSLGSLIPKLKESLAQYPHEIIVVSDGSKDATREIALSYGALAISHPQNLGKGAAMKTGVKNARGDTIVFLDGDGAHDPQDIHRVMAPILEAKADLVIGSRSLPGSRVTASPLSRRLSNNLSSLIISFTISFLLPWATGLNHALYHRKAAARDSSSRVNIPEPQAIRHATYRLVTGRLKRITDCTSGFRAITKEAWHRLELNSQRFEIETEMIYEAARNNLAIAEVPISCHWNNRRSRLSILRDGLKTLKLLAGKLLRDMVRR